MSRKALPRRQPVAVAATSSATGDPMYDSWQRMFDLTQSMLGASFGGPQAWMRGLDEWQQAHADSLRSACERIEQTQTAGQAGTAAASNWPTLWALQANLAGAEWTQAMLGQSRAMLTEASRLLTPAVFHTALPE